MTETIGLKELRVALEKTLASDLKQVAEGILVAAGIKKKGIEFYEKQAEGFRGEWLPSSYSLQTRGGST